MEQLRSTQLFLAPWECSPFNPWHIPTQPGQHKVENSSVSLPGSRAVPALITSSSWLQPLPEHLHLHVVHPWKYSGMLLVAKGQYTHFMEEI